MLGLQLAGAQVVVADEHQEVALVGGGAGPPYLVGALEGMAGLPPVPGPGLAGVQEVGVGPHGGEVGPVEVAGRPWHPRGLVLGEGVGLMGVVGVAVRGLGQLAGAGAWALGWMA
mmetsp:Transcript_18607/g.39970  ORF Transcript_18607/g.39970 Transcript_18607/m.39970 type:complete len:115 (-) Transcript_18607:585-929(-)